MEIKNLKINFGDGEFAEVETVDGAELNIQELDRIEDLIIELYELNVKNVIIVRK